MGLAWSRSSEHNWSGPEALPGLASGGCQQIQLERTLWLKQSH